MAEDITSMVDWALKIKYLSISTSDGGTQKKKTLTRSGHCPVNSADKSNGNRIQSLCDCVYASCGPG